MTLKEALTSLANQPDIAAYLTEEGLKGYRQSTCFCPVAQYLRREGFRNPEVTHGYAKAENQWVDMPIVIRDFITEFDRGQHRQLNAMKPLPLRVQRWVATYDHRRKP
jgi:hypothetical protein